MNLLEGQNQILRKVAAGLPLPELLSAIIHFMEPRTDGALCSVLLLEKDGSKLRWGAAPSLPEAYNRGVDGLIVGPCNGSCGTSIFRKERVIVTDIAKDPLWKNARELALAHGLRTSTSVPIFDSAGDPLGTFAFYYREPRLPSDEDLHLIEICRDLTSIAIERTNRERDLKEAIRVRDQFLSIASHELRTPLTTLQLQAQLLERTIPAPIPPKVTERVDSILRQTRKLNALVNEIIEVTRINEGRLQLEFVPFDLIELVHHCASAHAANAEKAECDIRISAPQSLIGEWDRDRIEGVIMSLLSNALKFGKGKPVDIRVASIDDRALIEVIDQGIGIAPEDHARIFECFERAVSERNYGGFGLGLWIARSVIDFHQGSIRVESKPGKGSRFQVELPLKQKPSLEPIPKPRGREASEEEYAVSDERATKAPGSWDRL